jgi:phosphonate transport system substrate-binding protein
MKRTSCKYILLLSLLCAAFSAQAQDAGLKMAVTAAFVSERGMPVYREIAKYLSNKLKRKTSLVSGISYSEADLLLEKGIIQIGFVCGLPYVHKHAEGVYTLVAIPVVAPHEDEYKGMPVYENIPDKYYSYTIVRKDSPITSWADLRGKSYAYNEVNSNSGYNMPRYKLVQLGAKSWEDYFSHVVVSGSHEESIRMVAHGEVDASSVDSMVFDYDRSIGNPDAFNVRIIETLFRGGAGVPPVVMDAHSDPALREAIQQVLVNMHKDPEGRRILKQALLLRFDPPNDANYDDIRRMEAAARKAGFRDPR